MPRLKTEKFVSASVDSIEWIGLAKGGEYTATIVRIKTVYNRKTGFLLL